MKTRMVVMRGVARSRAFHLGDSEAPGRLLPGERMAQCFHYQNTWSAPRPGLPVSPQQLTRSRTEERKLCPRVPLSTRSVNVDTDRPGEPANECGQEGSLRTGSQHNADVRPAPGEQVARPLKRWPQRAAWRCGADPEPCPGDPGSRCLPPEARALGRPRLSGPAGGLCVRGAPRRAALPLQPCQPPGQGGGGGAGATPAVQGALRDWSPEGRKWGWLRADLHQATCCRCRGCGQGGRGGGTGGRC